MKNMTTRGTQIFMMVMMAAALTACGKSGYDRTDRTASGTPIDNRPHVASDTNRTIQTDRDRQAMGDRVITHDGRTVEDRRAAVTREGEDRSCTLVADIPGNVMGAGFNGMKIRVYDDIWSPLFEKDRNDKDRVAKSHDERRTYDGRPWTDRGEVSDRRTLNDRQAALSEPERRVVEERRAVTTDDQGRVVEERSLTSSEERRRVDDTRSARTDRDNLIWSGRLQQGQKLDITSARGPIRYDYMFDADEWYHGNQAAWCSAQQMVHVP